ncbi:hypothetical protein M408DRAFT_328957 [Serendipita vermifera MAFF 305830]|uniref:Protein kinase domain-containing protein n=1 Tax=Serendipita vermifera MAFF 305830 TaxID=933852 RepID=A0A0C2XJS9_SERVB|nr:hypothetical protein M408DRAFT_328957 [Serendipita vermifera MAFF 305830]
MSTSNPGRPEPGPSSFSPRKSQIRASSVHENEYPSPSASLWRFFVNVFSRLKRSKAPSHSKVSPIHRKGTLSKAVPQAHPASEFSEPRMEPTEDNTFSPERLHSSTRDTRDSPSALPHGPHTHLTLPDVPDPGNHRPSQFPPSPKPSTLVSDAEIRRGTTTDGPINLTETIPDRQMTELTGASSNPAKQPLIVLEDLLLHQIPHNLTGCVTVPGESYQNPICTRISLVYKGLYDGQIVAVKVLQTREIQTHGSRWMNDNQRRVMREARAGALVNHPNINTFLGYSEDFGQFPALITVWCEHGTILNYLASNATTRTQRLQLALNITEGVRYLHDLGLIHGDLKPSNVLVDNSGQARLCDLGCVRSVNGRDLATSTPYTGTERYKAPELFISETNPRPVASLQGDIYALGCIHVEIVENIVPFGQVENDDLRNVIRKGDPPASPPPQLSAEKRRIWNLLQACWGEDLDRPPINYISHELRLILATAPQI